jgi:hypothetical protein
VAIVYSLTPSLSSIQRFYALGFTRTLVIATRELLRFVLRLLELPHELASLQHLHSRHPLSEPLAGIRVLTWQRKQVFVVRDDVGSVTGDSQFEKTSIIWISVVPETGTNRINEIGEVAQAFDHQTHDFGCDRGMGVSQFIPPEHIPVFPHDRTAQKHMDPTVLAQPQQLTRSGIAVCEAPHEDIGVNNKLEPIEGHEWSPAMSGRAVTTPDPSGSHSPIQRFLAHTRQRFAKRSGQLVKRCGFRFGADGQVILN